jgi:hypothetical protein
MPARLASGHSLSPECHAGGQVLFRALLGPKLTSAFPLPAPRCPPFRAPPVPRYRSTALLAAEVPSPAESDPTRTPARAEAPSNSRSGRQPGSFERGYQVE